MYVIDRVMKMLMMTSDDYILRIYIGTYVEEIISVKYDRCDVHCECIGSFIEHNILNRTLYL